MKYTTPIAERVSLEAVSVIMTSGDDGCGDFYDPSCPDKLPDM